MVGGVPATTSRRVRSALGLHGSGLEPATSGWAYLDASPHSLYPRKARLFAAPKGQNGNSPG